MKVTTKIQQLKEDISILQEKLRKLEAQQEPKMTLKYSGDIDVVSYKHKYYYRMGVPATGLYWWSRELGSSALYLVQDQETKSKLEQLYEDMILDTGGVVETEKRKIDDLAEKLLPEDHPYRMEELGFAKNAEGYWTAQPLGETTKKTTILIKNTHQKKQNNP